MTARGRRKKPDLRAIRYVERDRTALPDRERLVHFERHGWVSTRVVDRNRLAPGVELEGPCVVEGVDGTIVLDPGTRAVVDDVENIVITLDHETAR